MKIVNKQNYTEEIYQKCGEIANRERSQENSETVPAQTAQKPESTQLANGGVNQKAVN